MRRKTSAHHAITFLTDDHKSVQKIFKEFEKAKEREDESRTDLVEQACRMLTIHARIEEEIFYPAVRDAIDEEDVDLLDEALVEHASAKQFIHELEGMSPSDHLYDAKFTVLGEYINHHIQEEQECIFPLARKVKLDLEDLGERLFQRKEELEDEIPGGERGGRGRGHIAA
jgi:hemerythrin superfamily protein